ncbi:MAG: PspC domain-containing protein [Firmicutes bacterium]|nr:PspC domain-containing protein [Bacillota bacterium]
MSGKKLYKSRTDRKISGVCGGIAEYVGVDATLVRIVWLLLAFTSIGLIAYIICAVIMPVEPDVVDYRGGDRRDGDARGEDDRRN